MLILPNVSSTAPTGSGVKMVLIGEVNEEENHLIGLIKAGKRGRERPVPASPQLSDQRERERERGTEGERYREGERERGREGEREWERERERGRERERERE